MTVYYEIIGLGLFGVLGIAILCVAAVVPLKAGRSSTTPTRPSAEATKVSRRIVSSAATDDEEETTVWDRGKLPTAQAPAKPRKSGFDLFALVICIAVALLIGVAIGLGFVQG